MQVTELLGWGGAAGSL